MGIVSRLSGWFRTSGQPLGNVLGTQRTEPSSTLGESSDMTHADAALQIGAVWGCVERIASTIATLPINVYEDLAGKPGQRRLARESKLYALLHSAPNERMTPTEFWTAMILNLELRGNGYARIERNPSGEAFALWPMSADQVDPVVLDDGSMVYEYRIDNSVAVLDASSVLHIKGMGNGTVGLSRLDYMKTTMAEARNGQMAASKLFSRGGKPTGVLMVDNVLNDKQREAIQRNFSEMALGNTGRLFVLEASMNYQQLSLSPQDMQLLATRRFTKEEIGTWFGVPSILINQTEGTTTLGSSAAEIIESFYKLTIRPKLVGIEQAISRRVMTIDQRLISTVEFNQDGLLRASLKDRADIYAKMTQNGLKTRNEIRQLENDPPIVGGDELTAQSNLAPLHKLGQITSQGAGHAGAQESIAQ